MWSILTDVYTHESITAWRQWIFTWMNIYITSNSFFKPFWIHFSFLPWTWTNIDLLSVIEISLLFVEPYMNEVLPHVLFLALVVGVVFLGRSVVSNFATPWTAARQASLSITNSRSPPKSMSIKSVMLSSHLILCRPLLLLPLIPPSIRVFSNESTLRMRWPKYWSFGFSIILPMNTQDWFPLGWTGWISLQSKGLSRVSSSTANQKHQFFGTQLLAQIMNSLLPNSDLNWSK